MPSPPSPESCNDPEFPPLHDELVGVTRAVTTKNNVSKLKDEEKKIY